MNKPTIMFIRVSENCNSGCFMCGFAHVSKSYNISKEKFEYVLAKMKEEGTYKIVRYTGGEPLMNDDLPYFIKRCKEEGYMTSIITNGYLLPKRYKELADAGIDQIILSLDGSCPEVHDKLRNFRGCFDNLINGAKLIKEYKKDIVIRVNTVISKLNIYDLNNILDKLIEIGIDQWSIIPLRFDKNLWNDDKKQEYINIYNDFKGRVDKLEKPILLGYSKYWGGRNKKEQENLFNNNMLYRPNGECKLVNKVRFYIPDSDMFIPCNCASHRIHQIKIDNNKKLTMEEETEEMRKWLSNNGPKVCTGCEPLNVYLAENPDAIDTEMFSF